LNPVSYEKLKHNYQNEYPEIVVTKMYEVLKKAEKDINASLPTAHVDIGENNTNESASTSGNETV
jgi:hypothetical protein